MLIVSMHIIITLGTSGKGARRRKKSQISVARLGRGTPIVAEAD
jgi:hypothetical protein